jgi:hypothetical protein
MLMEAASVLQSTTLATALRASLWAYPIINAAHIVGLALLFGSIVPLDLRLLGAWRSVPIAALNRVLLPVALSGLALTLTTGPLLFAVRATEYAATPLFAFKLTVIACALANALLLRLTLAWRAWRDSPLTGTTPRLQLAGVLSIVLWLAVILAGRMIGYL